RLACYEKLVRNSDKTEVRNIKWEVANYRRRILVDIDKACPTLPGEVSQAPKDGPLHYGVSSEFYETSVLPPRDGWLKSVAVQNSDRTPLRSAFSLSQRKGQSDELRITSFMTSYGMTNLLSYEIDYSGEVPIRILINLPVAARMVYDLPFVKGDTEIPAHSHQIFQTKIDEPATAVPAVLVISDASTNEALAIDVAGVYAPVKGERQFRDETLFARIP